MTKRHKMEAPHGEARAFSLPVNVLAGSVVATNSGITLRHKQLCTRMIDA